ncbi:MAG: adenylosuccinate lyase [Spirochaetia bacterium]|nr:adenylosuccinate lyase [Spirochaetota bacterium]MCX8096819.1 adenylosuccinate lyase [Spirochaetota bacterium]MDW8112788.1 adenylosuccinate lyase [Spirochaetia bacterium]
MAFKHPLVDRYGSKEMVELFSEETKFSTWRKFWIVLAETQKELGLPITEEQIEEMKRFEKQLNLDTAKELEKELNHDVMSHIEAFGLQATKAKPIIHLGATSSEVTDNSEMYIILEALKLVRKRIIDVITKLIEFGRKYKSLPCLSYTHLQPAQPTTVGRRAILWAYDIFLDLEELDTFLKNIKTRGVKGTTGTQASYLELFEGDGEKVKKLDEIVSRKLGFKESFWITGQTYSRKYDYIILSKLAQIGASASKFANDVRYLQSVGEMEEPFGEKQVGSSAMPYKRNPILCERINSLARYLTTLPNIAIQNHLTQFLERTLDDSANRRIIIPEAFICTDAILLTYKRVVDGLKVNEEVIKQRMKEKLPFYAVENILMRAVKKGGDRQELHKFIRDKSMKVVEENKLGKGINLLDELQVDEAPDVIKKSVSNINDFKEFVGMSIKQVDEVSSRIEEYIKRTSNIPTNQD